MAPTGRAANPAANSLGVRDPRELCGLSALYSFRQRPPRALASRRLAKTSAFRNSSRRRAWKDSA